MKSRIPLGPLFLLTMFSGCATRPAYFGNDARVLRENGAKYWEAGVRTPSYIQARMRHPSRSAAPEATRYAGTLRLRSISLAVLRSTFTLREGESVSFHYDFNAYVPGAMDVVVGCAQGECWADAKAVEISWDGRVELQSKTIRSRPRAAEKTASAVDESLRKDEECAALPAKSAQRKFEAEGCAAWLDAHGGVGAAQRRVRVAQWTSIGGN